MILSYPLSYLYPQFKIWFISYISIHVISTIGFKTNSTWPALQLAWLAQWRGCVVSIRFFTHLGWLFYWENHIHFHSNALIKYVLILLVSLVCFYWLVTTVLFCITSFTLVDTYDSFNAMNILIHIYLIVKQYEAVMCICLFSFLIIV